LGSGKLKIGDRQDRSDFRCDCKDVEGDADYGSRLGIIIDENGRAGLNGTIRLVKCLNVAFLGETGHRVTVVRIEH
jgi:hypothetical protein